MQLQRLRVVGKCFVALASTIVLFVSGILVPPIGILVLPFVPQPVLSFGLNYGIGGGMGILLAAAVLLFIFASEELAIIYLLFALVAALLFGFLGRLRAIERLIMAVTTVVFSVTGGVLLYVFGSWQGMIHEFRESMNDHFAAALQVHEKLGFPPDALNLLRERAPHIIETMLQLLPGLIFVSLALVVLINVLLLCRRFPARRLEWLSIENLREWKGPEPMVWGLIVCGFALFIPTPDWARIIALNILVVIGTCYFAQGLAIIAFFFNKNNVPRFFGGLA
jgi:uncharacterized protein YybS (DUF2232 family)